MSELPSSETTKPKYSTFFLNKQVFSAFSLIPASLSTFKTNFNICKCSSSFFLYVLTDLLYVLTRPFYLYWQTFLYVLTRPFNLYWRDLLICIDRPFICIDETFLFVLTRPFYMYWRFLFVLTRTFYCIDRPFYLYDYKKYVLTNLFICYYWRDLLFVLTDLFICID